MVRVEEQRDHNAVDALLAAAFKGQDEVVLVRGLRKLDDTISLVEEQDGTVVGHILFSAIDIGGVPAMALAPVAVSPDKQGQGIGQLLCRAGNDVCRQRGHRLVVVLGHADYYSKFGFIPCQPLGIMCPWKVADPNFMALALVPGALVGIRGTVRYSAPFGAPDPA
jgi:putative acetyltransferase